MPHFDAARTRLGVHWYMIGAQESLVEILLLELPQFRLELVLRVIVSHPVRQAPPFTST
jgi:hypothetical protein